jgi:hypothetical protein
LLFGFSGREMTPKPSSILYPMIAESFIIALNTCLDAKPFVVVSVVIVGI